MKVTSAEFVISAMRPNQLPKDRRPEFAFVGRSNVGKSSLLNRLLNRKALAKTSGTPGKTQTINFFDINNAFYFVDLPGYGFAKVPKSVKRKWHQVMMSYLSDREPLRMVVQLIDSRHPPTPLDHNMLGLLDEAEVPTLLVATKVDKLKPSQRAKNLKAIRHELDLDDDGLIIPFSAITGEGVAPVWDIVEEYLKQKQTEA